MTHVPFIKKRCECCEKLFDIPYLKDDKAREIALIYTPCTWCGHVRERYVAVSYKALIKADTCSARNCKSCGVSFLEKPYKAKGMCHACLMSFYRKRNSTRK